MRCLAVLATLVFMTASLQAESPRDALYEESIAPLFREQCLKCHNAAKQRGGLDLSERHKLLEGGASGPVLTPGNAKQSLLLQLVQANGEPHMPPTGQLSRPQIDQLAKWIDGLTPSAPRTARVITEEDRQHWAFRPLESHLPKMTNESTIIDALIQAKLAERKLALGPPASKRELIRRAYFDLIGLPPSPEAVSAFLADERPDAFEQVIDRLLDSPQYGERWARHWLDLARFAESNGIGEDRDRPHAWRYRDYVIRAFNQDRPYGDFIREQLAGDEFFPDDLDAAIATGFCRHAPTVDVIRASDTEKYRLEELDDVLSTTGQVFMGLTIGCAKCHDHKYDPITQDDYYRLLAIFNSSDNRDLAIREGQPVWQTEPVSKNQTTGNGVKVITAKVALADSVMSITDIGVKPRPTVLFWRGDIRTPGPAVQPGVPEVFADLPYTIEPNQQTKTTGQRRAFANWLADPRNSLVYRVMANRLWQYHFGRGIVESSNNFGRNGDAPTHPELLDYLAHELIRNDGHLKPIHRLIMRSRTYQQSSMHRDEADALDPENRLWWRMPKRRLEAEALRDTILTVSGKRNDAMFGPSIRPRIHPNLLANNQMTKWPIVTKEGPEHWRRSIYVFVKRSLRLPFLELYDAPSPNSSCERRVESTVATQALLMMNNDFIQEQATFLAERIRPSDNPVSRLYAICYQRSPTADESTMMDAFMQQMTSLHQRQKASDARFLALVDLCQVMLSSNEFIYVD